MCVLQGVAELKRDMSERAVLVEMPEIHQFLDGFYLSRIGIRILIGEQSLASAMLRLGGRGSGGGVWGGGQLGGRGGGGGGGGTTVVHKGILTAIGSLRMVILLVSAK